MSGRSHRVREDHRAAYHVCPHKEYVFANVTELNDRISRTACDHGHQRDVHVQRLDHHQTGSTIVKTFLQDPVHARV